METINSTQLQLGMANELFYWLQSNDDVLPPPMNIQAAQRFEVLFGNGADLRVAVETIRALDPEMEIPLMLMLAGFEESVVRALDSDGLLDEAVVELSKRTEVFRQTEAAYEPAPFAVHHEYMESTAAQRDVGTAALDATISAGSHFVRLPVAPLDDLMKALSGGDDHITWQDKALCAQTDPEAFFPEKGGSTKEAKRVCAQCGVRDDCLQAALDKDERFGIWGGKSERERRRLKRAQKLPLLSDYGRSLASEDEKAV